jgi:hypothetical protein
MRVFIEFFSLTLAPRASQENVLWRHSFRRPSEQGRRPKPTPCGRNTFCAQGFCINRCSLDPPDFDGLLDDFRDLRYLPDPDGLPDCPHCYAIFDLAGLRTVLERGGVDQPVSLRLLQSSGKPFADFGTVKPHKGSWASVPLHAQPKLEGELSKDERCGYTLEIGRQDRHRSHLPHPRSD